MDTVKFFRSGPRIAGTIAALALLLTALTGCSMANGGTKEPLVTEDVADSESVIAALEAADRITAKKAPFSIGDRWTISADGEEIGEIRGEAIYLIGDTYSLFSAAGNLVGSEAEGYRVIHHSAKLYDHSNAQRGEIKQKFSWLLSEYEILDGESELRGTAKQKLSFTMNFDVLGKSGSAEYNISKAAFSFGADLTIEPKSKDRSVDAIDALWIAVIASEVEEAEAEKE